MAYKVPYSLKMGRDRKTKKGGEDGEREEAVGDAESNVDVASPGLAPRFKEGLGLCRRLLIHHTSRGPGSDTLQRLLPPAATAESSLSPFTQACPLL